MAGQTNEQLLEQLRAIGWTDQDIHQHYPDLLPDWGMPAPSTLFERLLSIGWSEERIRSEHPEILPASEGGTLETIGEPVYTLGERAGEPIIPPEPAPGTGAGADLAPSVVDNQTADLLVLGLIFL